MDNFSYPWISIKKIILLPTGLTIHYTTRKLLNILELDPTNTCEQLIEEGFILGYSNNNGEFNIKNYESNVTPLLVFVATFKITISVAHKIVRKYYSKQYTSVIHLN